MNIRIMFGTRIGRRCFFPRGSSEKRVLETAGNTLLVRENLVKDRVWVSIHALPLPDWNGSSCLVWKRIVLSGTKSGPEQNGAVWTMGKEMGACVRFIPCGKKRFGTIPGDGPSGAFSGIGRVFGEGRRSPPYGGRASVSACPFRFQAVRLGG
jgi:hypothetical protein